MELNGAVPHPVLNEKGVFFVGTKMMRLNLLSIPLSSCPQALLCSDHALTKLLMADAHSETSHRGRGCTLGRFRYRYWTTTGAVLANRVCREYQKCK